jgi:hypothetical protein
MYSVNIHTYVQHSTVRFFTYYKSFRISITYGLYGPVKSVKYKLCIKLQRFLNLRYWSSGGET